MSGSGASASDGQWRLATAPVSVPDDLSKLCDSLPGCPTSHLDGGLLAPAGTAVAPKPPRLGAGSSMVGYFFGRPIAAQVLLLGGHKPRFEVCANPAWLTGDRGDVRRVGSCAGPAELGPPFSRAVWSASERQPLAGRE